MIRAGGGGVEGGKMTNYVRDTLAARTSGPVSKEPVGATAATVSCG